MAERSWGSAVGAQPCAASARCTGQPWYSIRLVFTTGSLHCQFLCALLRFQNCLSWSGLAPYVIINHKELLEVAMAAKMTGRRSGLDMLVSQPANHECHLTKTLPWSMLSDLCKVHLWNTAACTSTRSLFCWGLVVTDFETAIMLLEKVGHPQGNEIPRPLLTQTVEVTAAGRQSTRLPGSRFC